MMGPPTIEHRPSSDEQRSSSALGRLHPGRHMWRFSAAVAAGWAVIVAALTTGARLTTSGEDQPSWGEVVGVTVMNAAMVFVTALALALVVRLVTHRHAQEPRATDRVAEQAGGIWTWTVRGHPVVPTTTEGRFAVAAALLAWVPFFAGPALFATPVLLILAWRRGDRAWLLILPVLAAVFLAAFIVAEFTVGHE